MGSLTNCAVCVKTYPFILFIPCIIKTFIVYFVEDSFPCFSQIIKKVEEERDRMVSSFSFGKVYAILIVIDYN